MAKFLSEEDHRLVSAAVTAAERSTDGEIVTIVNDASDDYAETAHIWAAAALFFYLSTLAIIPGRYRALLDMLGGWQHEWTAGEAMAAMLVGAVIVYALARLVFAYDRLRIRVTPGPVKSRRSRERAIEFFKLGAEGRTIGRTGILIYISLAEHRAEIVADQAIAARVEDSVWGEAMTALIAEIRAGRPGAGMAAAVTQVGAVLAEHLPKSEGNPNELPDRLIEL